MSKTEAGKFGYARVLYRCAKCGFEDYGADLLVPGGVLPPCPKCGHRTWTCH